MILLALILITEEPRGIAFVEYTNSRDCEDAKHAMDRMNISGREVRCVVVWDWLLGGNGLGGLTGFCSCHGLPERERLSFVGLCVCGYVPWGMLSHAGVSWLDYQMLICYPLHHALLKIMQIGVCFAQHGRKRPEIYMKGECRGAARGAGWGGRRGAPLRRCEDGGQDMGVIVCRGFEVVAQLRACLELQRKLCCRAPFIGKPDRATKHQVLYRAMCILLTAAVHAALGCVLPRRWT